MKQTNVRKKSVKTTGNRRIFVDLYIQSSEDKANDILSLVARFKGPKPAKRAIEQPGFLLDLMHSEDTIYMTTSIGSAGEPRTCLPRPGDPDNRTWWRGYARLSGKTPIIFWSLIWPRGSAEDDQYLDFVLDGCDAVGSPTGFTK